MERIIKFLLALGISVAIHLVLLFPKQKPVMILHHVEYESYESGNGFSVRSVPAE